MFVSEDEITTLFPPHETLVKRQNFLRDLLLILLVIAGAAVIGSLFLGLLAMARGGDFNRKYSNRLMRFRIISQGAAILLLLLFFLSRG